MKTNSSNNLLKATGSGCSFAKRPKSGAFTLIEIIVVVIILSIAAAMVVPMMGSADGVQLSSAANKILADLEYAKSMAISRGRYYTVVFNESANSYQIENNSGEIIEHPVRKSDYIERFGGATRLGKVSIANVNFDGADSITFDYLGCPYRGTDTSTPLNSGTVTLSAGDSTITVNVEAVTGYIFISQ